MTFNTRFLALLTLMLVTTGCVQVSTTPNDTGAVPDAPAVQISEPESPEITNSDDSVETTDEEPPQTDVVDIEPPARTDTDATIPVTTEAEQVVVTKEADQEPVTLTESPEQPVIPAQSPDPVSHQPDLQARQVRALCNEIGNKLGSVSVEDCLAQPLAVSGGHTVQGRPMMIRDFEADEAQEKNTRILILGGIHGDEYSSISIMFKWMEILMQSDNNDFDWRFVPTVNADGLLDGQAVRQNANGVDLNRNFPSEDWLDLAEDYWKNSTSRNPRRYPGTHPASEPEVQWIVDQIKSYKPDVIVSVHAPYHLLDYDGPPEAPQQIGELHLHLLGVYPGSLGNYAGINLGIPVVTMELPSAGIMPSNEKIENMWDDLLAWLYEHHES